MTKTIKIEATNAFSTVNTSLQTENLQIVSEKSSEVLVKHLCEIILNGKLEKFIDFKFFTIWNNLNKETKAQLVTFFHVFVTTYHESDHQFRSQQILLEDVSKYCLLEMESLLSYWVS